MKGFENRMFGVERKSEILKLLEQNGRVAVNELASFFHTSRETIRRDLNEMEIEGLLKRAHGGAVLDSTFSSSAQEFPVNIREIQRYKEKNAICQYASSFIKNGDSVFIDNSSTCLYLIQYIPEEYQITIITNSIKILIGSNDLKKPNLMFICLGGFYHKDNLSTYGNISLRDAGDFYPHKSFMSCGGILPPDRFTDSSILEVDTKRLMIERSQEVFILADHTKFGRSSQVWLSDSKSIDYVITDNKAPTNQFSSLEKAGIKIFQVDAD